jgi:hypothetical protein
LKLTRPPNRVNFSGKLFGQVRLDFRLDGVMDQTYLPLLIAQLDEVEREFPVKGTPKG